MGNVLSHVDDLLRGRRTDRSLLDDDAGKLALRVFVPAAIVLGLTYGFFMGWYAIGAHRPWALLQAAATTVKLPAVFLVTLFITFPSLYVFNALVGCRLRPGTTMRLLVGAIVVNLAVAASLGPILGFFTLSTTSYPFMVFLNVVLLGLAGLVGLAFLLRTLRRLAVLSLTDDLSDPPSQPSTSPLAPEGAQPWSEYAKEVEAHNQLVAQRSGAATAIFRIWVVLYGFVGLQTGWLLRPFIGHPDATGFRWIGERGGNAFLAVWQTLGELLGA